MQKQSIEDQILQYLTKSPIEDTLAYAHQLNVSHQQLDAVLKSLLVSQYVNLKNKKKQQWKLTKWGEFTLQKGAAQLLIYQQIKEQGSNKQDVQNQLNQISPDIFKYGFGQGMKQKLYLLQGKVLKRIAKDPQDKDRIKLQMIKNNKELSNQEIKNLKGKKLIESKVQNYYLVQKGPKYRQKRVQLVPQLTSQMIQKGTWKDLQFRPFNLKALGANIEYGNLHPLMRMKRLYKDILLSMGFQQMKTNQYVESNFWNFDSLFVPQMHPARDAQDTFLISDPPMSKIPYPQYVQNVKKIHEQGGYGSKGYDYKWDQQQSKKNVLRTHTTAISAKILYRLSQIKDFTPKKYFSIDRVFRNQSLDATHLAQFHQVQGVVIGQNLGLGHLIGVITQFFNKIGIKQLWYKPAYNPYTEPSLEIFGYHPLLKKKVEIGNSGIFRPEMLRPMGWPQNIDVIAWGLSLQRPTMIQLGMSNIRDLIGYEVNLKWLKQSPVFSIN